MADDKKQQPAGPSEGDPRVAAKVKPAKDSGASHGATSGGSTSTAPAGGRSR